MSLRCQVDTSLSFGERHDQIGSHLIVILEFQMQITRYNISRMWTRGNEKSNFSSTKSYVLQCLVLSAERVSKDMFSCAFWGLVHRTFEGTHGSNGLAGLLTGPSSYCGRQTVMAMLR